jgi:ABC-type phosphate transport system substrate-binding protein
MTFQLNKISLYSKYFTVLLLLGFGSIVHAQDSTLSVITNIKGAPANLSMAELKSVLKGERQRWGDGTKVSIVLMMTKTAVGKTTCFKIYGMSGDKLKRYWAGLQLAGKADAPTFCNSEEELMSNIADNPGAIGIIDKILINPNIKVTTIDGKKSF